MTETSQKVSPLHDWFQPHETEWGTLGEMPTAIRVSNAETERAIAKTLGLCDLSCLCKLGIKGRESEKWLTDRHIELPDGIYESRGLTDDGLIIRLAADEFFLESGIKNETVPGLEKELASSSGELFPVVREDATILLVGSRSLDVFAQTCGVNFREATSNRLVLTRVAGVNCGVFPTTVNDIQAFRIWVDFSYACSLWETLVEICDDLGGGVIGAGCLFPELA